MHSQRLVCANEDIIDFKAALEAEKDRRMGKRLPKTPNKIPSIDYYLYSEIIKFADQVDRYFKVFGRNNVHVIIFDEFKYDIETVYQNTLNFLNVDSTFKANFEIRNPNTRIKNLTIYRWLMNPPSWVFNLGRIVTPSFLIQARRKIAWSTINNAKSLLKNESPRPPLDSDLEQSLKLRFSYEVEKLSELLDKDLTHWSHS